MTMTKMGVAEPALVLNQDSHFKLALEPSNFEEAYRVAAMCAKIQLCGSKTPEDALVRMMAGRELGLSAFQSMRLIYVVEGRPGLDASLMLSLCLNHPACEYFDLIDTSPEKATYEAKRKGRKEQRLSWTIEQARKAKLLDRGQDPSMNNWNRYPDAMLRARCVSALARIVFPDAVAGLYSREELTDGDIVVPAEVRAELVASPAPSRSANEQPVSQAPVRDYEAEAIALKEQIANARTPEDRKAARAAVAGWDAGEPWAGDVKRFYNMTLGQAQAANGAASAREPGQEG